MTEMYKTINGLNPSFMLEIFYENARHYNLRNNNEFVQPRVKSFSNGTESVRFKGPQLWQMLQPTIQHSESLCQFKTKIRTGTGKITHADYAKFYSEFGLSIINNSRFLLYIFNGM